MPALWAVVAIQVDSEHDAAILAAAQGASAGASDAAERLEALVSAAEREAEFFALTYPAPGRAISVRPYPQSSRTGGWRLGIVDRDGRVTDSEPGFELTGAAPAPGRSVATGPRGIQLRIATPLSTGATAIFVLDPARYLNDLGRQLGWPGTLALSSAARLPCPGTCLQHAEKVRGLPFHVVASVDEHRALDSHSRRRNAYLAVTVSASLLILSAFAALVRQGQRLSQAKGRLRAAIDGSLDAFYILTPLREPDGTVTDFIVADLNERGAQLAHMTREQLAGKPAFGTLPAYRDTGLRELYCNVMASQVAVEEERELFAGTPQACWYHFQVVPLENGVAVSVRDIRARKEQERQLRQQAAALRESEARVRTVADTIPAMVAYIDSNQVYRFLNRAYEPEFAGTDGGVVGRAVRDVVPLEWYERCRPYIERALRGETVVFEDADERAGSERTMHVTYIPQRDEHGGVAGFHVMRQDISAHQRERMRLLTLARQDPLTGLANRAGFEERLEASLLRAETGGKLIAVMYIDLDCFKPVNDVHGHAAGDELLVLVARRLCAALRAGDTVARLGGDEFAVLIEDLARHDDAGVAAAKVVAALQPAFALGAASVSVTASVGVTVHVAGSIDPAALLARADAMLYHAKKAGKNTWRVD